MPLLWACFTLSGAAGLALEMLWMRSATLVFGQTPATTAAVLAWYFAGLGFGAAWARTTGEQAIRRYGRLELGAALGALWSLLCFRVFAGSPGAVSGTLLALAAMGLAMLPSAFCLGATLPVLGHALVRASSSRGRAGALYAVNTIGGAVGTAVAGFGLPAWIGLPQSYVVTAGCSALSGLVALALAARDQPVEPVTLARLSSRSPESRDHLLAAAAVTGGLALALEVLWTRLFAQVLHNSVYSFGAIALVYLVAIAAGAALAARFLRDVSPRRLAASALVMASISVISGLWIFVAATDGLTYFGMNSGLGEYLARIVLLATATAGPTAMASGIVLPALWASWGLEEGAAPALGNLTAANTFGGVAGALVAGFVGFPLLGVRGSLAVSAVAYAVLADVIDPGAGRWSLYAALLAVAVFNPLRAPIVHLRSPGERLRTLSEEPAGIVSVVDTDDDRQLRLDNSYVLGGSQAASGERRLGLLPLLLHPSPKRALFVGLATGISASAGPALAVDQTTVVELIPGVVNAARDHFSQWNADLMHRPDVRIEVGDGRRFLAASPERFDVIVSDLFIPWHPGTGNLYSREMYSTVAGHLAAGGLFCQWLPLYQLTRSEFDLIARTFLDVFPHVSLWRSDFYADRPVVGLVGQMQEGRIDLAAASQRASRLPDWGSDPMIASERGLAMFYVGDLAGGRAMVSGATINTDDRPLIEFLAPRLTSVGADGDKQWFIGDPLADFYDGLAKSSSKDAGAILPPSDELVTSQQAGTLLYRYALAATRKDTAAAAGFEEQVRRMVPEVIAGVEASRGAASPDPDDELAKLHEDRVEVRKEIEALERRVSELGRSPEGNQK